MIRTGTQFLDPFLTVTQIRAFKENSNSFSATGFFFAKDDRLFLITNRHVIYHGKRELMDKISIKLHMDATFENHYDMEILLKKTTVLLPINQDVDVAAIELNRSVFEKYHIHAFCTSNRWLNDIADGADVSVIGYPLGYFDDRYNLPILRHATVATKWKVDFKGKPMFLIDARLHEGTSGAPVILKPTAVLPTLFRSTESLAILLGIHSSEWSVDISKKTKVRDKPFDLNVVWYSTVLDEILR